MGGQARRARGRILGALLLAAVPGGTSWAQTYSFGSVVVEGNQRVETGTVLAQLGISQGQAVSAGELNDAVQNLRASGLFETVEVVPDGSTLRVRVTEQPTIGRIAFEGNSVISDERLATLVGSIERRVFSPTQAETDTAAIAQAYVNEGRVNAVVVPSIIRREDGAVDLVFQVDEGGQTEIERISFVGNRDFSERRLRGVLETKQAGLLRFLFARDTFVAERIEFDRQVLVDFYRSRGYADFSVQNVDVNLTRERDAYLVTFNVQEGQRFEFGAVTVTSAVPEADVAAFQAVVRTRPGQTYSPVAVENDIARIEALAVRQGLNFVTVDPRITRDDRGRLLNIEYALIRGERIFVERIDIEGNSTTLDRVIRQQFRTVEGDPFNPRSIRESAERIRALGFFADAEVEAREGSGPDQVVIDVNVVEQPTGSLSFGANYSSENGPALTAAFAETNFLGRGQALEFQLSTGADNRVLSIEFTEPRFLGRDVALGLDLAFRGTNNADALYDTTTFRFSPSLAFPITERGRLTILYAAEYTDITDVDDEASTIILAEAARGGVWTNALGYAFSFDTRRNRIETDTSFVFRAGQEFGFGDQAYIRSTGLAAAETRVLGDDVVLRATIEGGLLDYENDDSRVTDRFFLGSRVLRGFERQGVGPRDAATDDALGGNAFAVLRLESEFPLGLPEEYGVTGGAFFDYGSVWNVGNLQGLPETEDEAAVAGVLYNDFTPRAVVGLSIFANTPLGPLRFNFTEALEAEERDRPVTFDVTVSTTF
jgi:outer membrane protein insertion porin family